MRIPRNKIFPFHLFAAAVVLVLLGFSELQAGEFNPQLNVGDSAPVFADLPGVDGKRYSLKSFAESKVLVLVFTCNSCPYAVDYEIRLVALQELYAPDKQVQLVAINCNLEPADSMEKMKARAEQKGFNFPYLLDETQQSAKDYGALRTPECFVLNPERKVVYMGAFDDSTNPDKVDQRYVFQAIEAELQRKNTEITETPPIGCLIRLKRNRR